MSGKGSHFHVDSARLRLSVGDARQIPAPEAPEVCVVGRSNVGKSSLINLLLSRRNLARTSRSPGRTRLVNFFSVSVRVDSGVPIPFEVVDLPGYGFAKISRGEKRRVEQLLQAYLVDAGRALSVVHLVDSRREPSDLDLEMYEGLIGQGAAVVVAVTKVDAVAKAKRVAVRQRLQRAFEGSEVVLTSAQKQQGRDQLWRALQPHLEGVES